MRPLQIALAAMLGVSGCNAVQLNRGLLRRRFAWSGVTEHEVTLPSGRMRYFDGGSGSPVLLIHGFGFGALENWEKQVPKLARHHRVIAPDLYWFGRSVPSTPVETARAQAEGMRELLDSLGVARVDVVGGSYGGLIATDLAIDHPERVSRLVLVDAVGLSLTHDEQQAISSSFGGKHRVEDLLIPADVDELRSFLRTVFHKPKSIPTWALRDVLNEFWRNRDPKVRLCRSLAVELPDLAALQRVTARTLVIWGRYDPLLPLSMGMRLSAAIPGAQLHVMERSAHSPMFEEIETFNRLVLDFLAAPPTLP